jgi:D-arabinan exo alpha-(1,3)/(1,5)-arabinofuranosidase (non-reducing end)
MILLPTLFLAASSLLAAQADAQADAEPVGVSPDSTASATQLNYQDLLDRSINLTWQAGPVLPGEHTRLFSSQDPSSQSGPGSPGWFSTQDQGHFLAQLQNAGRTEYLMVDAQGPGMIARIRLQEAHGTLRFYVDGATTPAIEIEAAKFFGRGGPFQPPLIRSDANGSLCWVPLPFAKSMRVTTSDKEARYEISVHQFPADFSVPSLSGDLLSESLEQIKRLGTRIATNEDPELNRRSTFMTGASNKSHVFRFDIKGNGVVRWMKIGFISADKIEPNEMQEYMRSLRFQVMEGAMFTDSQFLLVDAPFGDFFGTAPGLNTFRSSALSVDATGQRFTCRFPMPYVDGFRVNIITEREMPKTVYLRLDVGFEQMLTPPPLRFRADFFQKRGLATRPVRDESVALLKGPGRLVGCTFTVLNPTLETWDDGAVKLWVDGEDFPSWFGTGSSEYFDRVTRNDGPDGYGYTSLNRVHAGDAVPFQEELRFDLELNHSQDAQVDWEGVLYWYGPARKVLPFDEVSGENLVVAPLPAPNFEYIEGMIECEDMAVIKLDSQGQVKVLESLPGVEPPHGKLLAVTGAHEEDYLKLAFPVAGRGEWDITLKVLHWPGGPTVQAYFDGKVIRGPFSLDSGTDSMQWKKVQLGNTILSGRGHILTLALESEPGGSGDLSMALDYLQLLPHQKQ